MSRGAPEAEGSGGEEAERTALPGDLYAVLGVSSAASADELRAAYRRLALEWHPDKHPGSAAATARFQAVAAAYAVLGDPRLRRDYDAFGDYDVSQLSGADFLRRNTRFILTSQGLGAEASAPGAVVPAERLLTNH